MIGAVGVIAERVSDRFGESHIRVEIAKGDELETLCRATSTRPPHSTQRVPSKTGVTPQSRQREASRLACSASNPISTSRLGSFNRSEGSSV